MQLKHSPHFQLYMENANTSISSLGIIMDGNRRYAREHGLSMVEGHRRGLQKMHEVVSWAKDAGVKQLVVYAFSSENWKRSEEEVADLVSLMREAFSHKEGREKIKEHKVRVRFIGDLNRLPDDLKTSVRNIEEETAHHADHALSIALSYGGQDEILFAVNALLEKKANHPVSKEVFESMLWSGDMTAPDLIIRTGGEKRLSNFLTWHSAYAELAFIETFWPALTKEEFLSTLSDASERERRFGR